MTIAELIGSIPQSDDTVPPPVNNACVPDIYNKLDAEAIERTRVINSQLDLRLNVQERVLYKHRHAAELRYMRERDKVRLDLRNIARRLPNYSEIPQLETKLNQLKKRKRRLNGGHKHNCVFTTEPLDISLALEKDDKPFCDRFFTHHLPTKSRFYKDVLPSVKKGISAPELRAKHPGMRAVFPLRPMGGALHGNQLPALHSMDDNFVKSKSFLLHDDDDSRTV